MAYVHFPQTGREADMITDYVFFRMSFNLGDIQYIVPRVSLSLSLPPEAEEWSLSFSKMRDGRDNHSKKNYVIEKQKYFRISMVTKNVAILVLRFFLRRLFFMKNYQREWIKKYTSDLTTFFLLFLRTYDNNSCRDGTTKIEGCIGYHVKTHSSLPNKRKTNDVCCLKGSFLGLTVRPNLNIDMKVEDISIVPKGLPSTDTTINRDFIFVTDNKYTTNESQRKH